MVLDSHRVAVLPFASMSPSPEDEYFADGMTEEVISTLSRVPEVEVISRTSVMQYKKNPRPLKEVSRELGAGTVLEGSVRKAGNHLRITVQMIDASKDRHLWSESYDRELHDVFAIQSEVASRVADALKVKPHEAEAHLRKKPTDSTEAYTLYLKGRVHMNKRGVDDIKSAQEYFERAIKEDPSFALGYAGLADCYQLLAVNWQIEQKANHERAKTAITKALALDAGLAEAHASLGLLFTAEFRLRDAADELRKAIAQNPNYAPARLWYYQILLNKGNLNEAQEQIEKAVELDPFSTLMNVNHGGFYAALRDYPAATALIKRAVDLDPGFAIGHTFLGAMYGIMKMLKEAQAEYDIAVNLMKKQFPLVAKSAEAYMAFFGGDKETAKRLLPVLEANPDESLTDGLALANFYFFLGELDEGFERLEKAYADKDQSLLIMRINPLFADSIRADPRFERLLKKLELN